MPQIPHRRRWASIFIALCVLAAAPLAWGQPATTPSEASLGATQPALAGGSSTQPLENIRVLVTVVRGSVQVRAAEDQPWKKAEVGMLLPVGAEFRTGVRSLVQFRLPPDQVITLDRLGTIKVLDAIGQGKNAKTDLGMKYGRTQYQVESSEVKHETSIRSPSATLAIRGTESVIAQDDYLGPMQVVTQNTRLEFSGLDRKTTVVGGPGHTANITSDKNSAGDTANQNQNQDAQGKFAGKTNDEQALQLALQTYNGNSFQDLGVLGLLDQARAEAFKGSLIGALPIGEELDFLLSWTAAAGVDVDLEIVSPIGTLGPKPPARTTLGGIASHSGDHVAGSDGAGMGQEAVIFAVQFPPGNYTVRAKLVSGAQADFSLFAIRDPSGVGTLLLNHSGTLTAAQPIFQQTIRP